MEVVMTKSLIVFFAVAFGLLIVSAPLGAHHGAASFETDPAKRITIKGTVLEWTWANPHCFLQFDAKDADGKVVHWVVETSNPPDMINRGWSIRTFKPGDEVTVTIRPVKNGKPYGSVVRVVLADGRVLSAVGGEPGTASPAP
jgi:Family of unknown function (DUF6152)